MDTNLLLTAVLGCAATGGTYRLAAWRRPGRAARQAIVRTAQPAERLATELLYRPQWPWRGMPPTARMLWPMRGRRSTIIPIHRTLTTLETCAGRNHRWVVWYRHLVHKAIPQALEDTPRVSFNLDSAQLMDERIMQLVEQIEQPERVAIEWVESPCSGNAVEEAAARLLRLRASCGFAIAVDDAGAGHDALERIRLTRPDWIKIDGRLFQAGAAAHECSEKDSVADLACRALAKLANDSGAVTVAEWVETPAQLHYANLIGCELAQGYLFSG